MFNLHNFVMNTICKMIGNEPDYKVQQYALGWFDKEGLTAEDMEIIATQIAAQYPEPETAEEPEPETELNN